MTNLIVDDELAKRLEAIAEKVGLPLDKALRSLADMYDSLAILPDDVIAKVLASPSIDRSTALLEAMDGIFDDNVTDLSTTVREIVQEYYQKKYGNPD